MQLNPGSRADVIVVGAGIGGLVAALALVQKGISVRVVEQASELKEIGAGIQLSANATRRSAKQEPTEATRR